MLFDNELGIRGFHYSEDRRDAQSGPPHKEAQKAQMSLLDFCAFCASLLRS
jgi:hypothetical protein